MRPEGRWNTFGDKICWYEDVLHVLIKWEFHMSSGIADLECPVVCAGARTRANTFPRGVRGSRHRYRRLPGAISMIRHLE